MQPDDPDIARALDTLGRLYTSQGKYAEAEPLFKCSLAIGEKSLGKDHHRVGLILQNYATLLRKTGREAAAQELEQRVEVIRHKRGG